MRGCDAGGGGATAGDLEGAAIAAGERIGGRMARAIVGIIGAEGRELADIAEGSDVPVELKLESGSWT